VQRERLPFKARGRAGFYPALATLPADKSLDISAAIDGGTAPRDARGVPCHAVPESAWRSLPAFRRVAVSTWRLYQQ
jgi:hypothetical protein